MRALHFIAGLAVSATRPKVAETANANGVPGNTVLIDNAAGVANVQVATGQTLTNSIQNVAEGDISAPFILPFAGVGCQVARCRPPSGRRICRPP